VGRGFPYNSDQAKELFMSEDEENKRPWIRRIRLRWRIGLFAVVVLAFLLVFSVIVCSGIYDLLPPGYRQTSLDEPLF
jgi:hypothetical protein